MKINKFNAEGYYDPTAYEALSSIVQEEKKECYRPLVFICSPYAGDVRHNTHNARRYSRYAVKKNYIPIAPHLLFPQFMDDENPEERATALFMGMVLMGKCKEVWVFGNTISPGMTAEIEKAMKRELPIRFFNENCEEVKCK